MKQGSGVGAFLLSPQGEEFSLAIRFNFKASNNDAEYEALLARLWTAKYVGATRVLLYSDSQLAAQQAGGRFEVKNERLHKYLHMYQRL